MDKRQVYFILVPIAIFLSIASPLLFSDGMFMDGVFYATIGRNWADGLGTFWRPLLTETYGNPFYEHPPLAFFLQGVLFKLFGDHYWVERFYSLFTHVIMGFILWKLWKLLVPEKQHKLFWLPLLFWLLVARVSWSLCNNVLENTLMIFTSLSLFYMLKALLSKKSSLNFLLAGFMLFLAFLAKGLVAFFPLSLLFFYFLFHKSFNFIQTIKASLLLLVGLALPFLFLFVFVPEGIEFIEKYLEIQVVNSLKNVQTVDSRFFILRKFFEEPLFMFIVTALLLILNQFKFRYSLSEIKEKKGLLFSLTGLVFSGVLPILISLKQNTFYINPVFPLASLILAMLVAPIVLNFIQNINYQGFRFKVFKVFSVLLFTTSIVLLILPAREVKRDKKQLQDIRAVIEEVGPHSTIYLSDEYRNDWSMYSYFYRYAYISFSMNKPEEYKFLVRSKNNNKPLPKGFQILRDDLNELSLYRKK